MMERAGDILRYTQSALYLALGVVAVLQFARRRRAAEGWAAATFGVLAFVVLVGLFLPQEPERRTEAIEWVLRVLIAVLVLFPYLIFRFTEAFERAPDRWRLAAVLLTGATVVGIFFVPEIPATGEPRPAPFTAYIVLLLVQWILLSVYAAARLWRSGRRQPRIARRRMGTIAVALSVLALILVIGGAAPAGTETTPFRLVVQVIGLLAAPLFILGFAPPPILVWLWRRPDEEALRTAEASLMEARSPAEIGAVLLPHAVHIVGGSAAVLVDPDGERIAAYGDPFEVAALAATGPAVVRSDSVTLPGENATLHVQMGPYAPYFGREELRILETLASLTDLALARSVLLDEQQKMVRSLTAANETMRDFVAIASHDLRSPLAVVEGLIEMLDEHWFRFDEQKRRDQVAAIRRQSAHLSRLVEDLLTVSKIDAGALQPQICAVHLRRLIEPLVGDFVGQPGEYVVRVPDDLFARTDPEHVSRMIINYLQNARVYGAPPIEVEARDAGERVEVRVSDRGPGVPPEFRDRMFQKFARADKRTSAAAQGTGLGLAIVRGLARASGGDAWYEERPQGACFVIALPKEKESPLHEAV